MATIEQREIDDGHGNKLRMILADNNGVNSYKNLYIVDDTDHGYKCVVSSATRFSEIVYRGRSFCTPGRWYHKVFVGNVDTILSEETVYADPVLSPLDVHDKIMSALGRKPSEQLTQSTLDSFLSKIHLVTALEKYDTNGRMTTMLQQLTTNFEENHLLKAENERLKKLVASCESSCRDIVKNTISLLNAMGNINA